MPFDSVHIVVPRVLSASVFTIDPGFGNWLTRGSLDTASWYAVIFSASTFLNTFNNSSVVGYTSPSFSGPVTVIIMFLSAISCFTTALIA